jgi:hypothetical protein
MDSRRLVFDEDLLSVRRFEVLRRVMRSCNGALPVLYLN